MPIAAAIGAIASMLTALIAGPNATSLAAGLSTEPPGQVSVEVIVASGSGCPANTIGVSVSPNYDAFVVTYDAFHAQVGVGAAPTDFRKNCQLNIRIRIPQGYSYAIAGVDHRGSAHLQAGASGLQQARYYFSGQSATALATHRFNGPFDDAWQTTDNVDVASLVFSPCHAERNININSELRVSAGTSNPAATNSSMTMDSTSSDIYRFVWRECA
jgi:hypothetical protein